MNKIVTYLSIFGAGCIVGMLGTKSYFEKKERSRADAEIESMKKYISKHAEATGKSNDNNESVKFEFDSSLNERSSLELDVSPEKREFYRTRYYTLSEDLAEKEHPEEDDVKQYQIDIDTFDEVDGYRKEEYSYYVEDGTLVDANDNILVIGDTISVDNMDAFENSTDDIWYIRNEGIKTDFEITKVYSSYSMLIGDDY